jgi:MFS superfamily sulfate permease-like transporter
MRRSGPFDHVAKDLPAALVVLLVALPLCLGIALGSNAPLIAGLVAGVVGGVVVGLVSRSPLSVSGPAAGLTTIVAAAIATLPSYEAFALAVVMAGIMQIVLGMLRAGVIGDYVPNSVIKGMLAAIGIILILKQLPHLVGYDADFVGDENFLQPDRENTFSELLHMVRYITPAAVIIGLSSIAVLLLWERPVVRSNRLLGQVPGPLMAVLLGALLNELLAADPRLVLGPEHLVDIPDLDGPGGPWAALRTPDLAMLREPAVWTTALTLAIVASLESLLGVEAVDKLDPFRRVTPPSRELVAQGAGNIVSGMLGGLPVTSVIVRSSANVNAGAVTKLSTISHGLLMLVSVLMIPGLLERIPYAALAAILIVTGYKLAKVALFKDFYRKGMEQFIPFVVTIVAIVLSDLLKGILVGLVVGIFYMVRSNFRTAILMVNDGDRYLMRLRKDVSFLNKPLVKRMLEELPAGAYLLVDPTRADFIDQDVLEVIREFKAHAGLKGITVEVKRSLHKPMHELLD